MSVNLAELLSCCCDAAERAGAIIRAVHAERQQAGHGALGASLKDASCERSWATVADMRAQALIVAALRLEFPGINIVGEEDEEEAAGAAAAAAADAAAVDDDGTTLQSFGDIVALLNNDHHSRVISSIAKQRSSRNLLQQPNKQALSFMEPSMQRQVSWKVDNVPHVRT
jgi:3'-phosphoadenosine 5'-phosphosulfate (PAPS) 3'-phosphatase